MTEDGFCIYVVLLTQRFSHELKMAEPNNSFDFFHLSFIAQFKLEDIFGCLRFNVGSALTSGWIAQDFIHLSFLKPPGTKLAQILWEIGRLLPSARGLKILFYSSELLNAELKTKSSRPNIL